MLYGEQITEDMFKLAINGIDPLKVDHIKKYYANKKLRAKKWQQKKKYD